MQTLGSVASVIVAIRDEAAAQIEQIAAKAGEQNRELQLPGPPAEIPDRHQQIAAALKRNAEALAQEEWESRRRLIEQREEWIARVVERGNEILRLSGEDVLQRLTREALELVAGERVELIVSERDRARIDEAWCGAISSRLVLAPETAPISGGCILRSGAIVFDNSFEERGRRLEPRWRSTLAAMYRL